MKIRILIIGFLLMLMIVGFSGCLNLNFGHNSLMFVNQCNVEIHIDFRVILKVKTPDGNTSIIPTGYEFLMTYLPSGESYLYTIDSSRLVYNNTANNEYTWYISVYSNLNHSEENIVFQKSSTPVLNTNILKVIFHQDGNVEISRQY